MRTAPLTAQARQDALDAMRGSAERGNELDVLVIGGGVTGAGIALDAVSRGLSTAIVEAQDWASGTSSRSSKLVHGGLRYLQMLDFHLVREALTERDLLINRLAPHLVKPVSFLYPLENRVWERAYVGAGVALYDTLASVTGVASARCPIHRHLTRKGMERLFPDLRARRRDRRGPVLGRQRRRRPPRRDPRAHRRQLRRARRDPHPGGRPADHHRRRGHRRRGASTWRPASTSTSGRGPSSTRPACGPSRPSRSPGAEGGLRVLASKGIHIVVPRSRIAGDVGLILQTEKSVLFIIPWSRYWVIGTTDTPWEQELVHPVATSADIDYVIEHANTVLSRPITREDIIGTWAGLRPLLQPQVKAGTSSAKVSREHTVAAPAPGLTVIAGGKLTTYRVMAKDAVDFAIGSRATSLPSITARPAAGRRRGPAGVPAPGPRDRPEVRVDPAAHGPPAAPVRVACWASSSTSSTPTRRSPSR